MTIQDYRRAVDCFEPDVYMKRRIAARLEQDTMRRIDARISAIEPAIVILTALLAGVILLSVMLPLMSIMSTIG